MMATGDYILAGGPAGGPVLVPHDVSPRLTSRTTVFLASRLTISLGSWRLGVKLDYLRVKKRPVATLLADIRMRPSAMFRRVWMAAKTIRCGSPGQVTKQAPLGWPLCPSAVDQRLGSSHDSRNKHQLDGSDGPAAWIGG